MFLFFSFFPFDMALRAKEKLRKIFTLVDPIRIIRHPQSPDDFLREAIHDPDKKKQTHHHNHDP